jgi:hypothetical protein
MEMGGLGWKKGVFAFVYVEFRERVTSLYAPENLAGGDVDPALGHDAEAALGVAGDELTEVADPGRLLHHLVVPDVPVTLHIGKQG